MPHLEDPPVARKKPGPKPAEGEGRTELTTIRSTASWKEWLDQLAEYDANLRRAKPNVSETVDRSVVVYAREIGFKVAAPIR